MDLTLADWLHPMTKRLRLGVFGLLDAADRIRGKKRKLVPPRTISLRRPSAYQNVGARFKRYLLEYGGLQRDHKVLDVGCGAGRIATALTRYLRRSAMYRGFDVSNDSIQWCRRNISKKFPHFKFQAVELYNGQYHPDGALPAETFKFPYKDRTFDFVILVSVFTHMRPKEVENYVSEISRVLKNGGRCFISFFLLNEESRNLLEAGKSDVAFRFPFEGCLVKSLKHPEFAIAYDQEQVRDMFKKNGLTFKNLPLYGSWCGRDLYVGYQDIVIADKKAKKPAVKPAIT